jgi:hypothetical protein
MRPAASVALLAVAVAAAAGATDLVNKDQAAYTVTVTSGSKVVKAEVKGKSVLAQICPSTAAECLVTVENVGEIAVTGADDVVILGSRLSKN